MSQQQQDSEPEEKKKKKNRKQLLTRAVTHIRLLEVNPGKLGAKVVVSYETESMTSPFNGEACESESLASRIDQTQSQS